MFIHFTISNEILNYTAAVTEKLAKISDKTSLIPNNELELEVARALLELEHMAVDKSQIEKLLKYEQPKDVTQEVLAAYNILKTYRRLDHFDALSPQSFLQAHRMMAQGLEDDAGSYRTKNVLHQKGRVATHLSTPHHLVQKEMYEYFQNRLKENHIPLIEACLAFFELLMIEPFATVSQSTCFLWWKVSLIRIHPVFRLFNIEKGIVNNMNDFHLALIQSGKLSDAGIFVNFCLSIIHSEIQHYFFSKEKLKTGPDRIGYYAGKKKAAFSRKDYLETFEYISSATATRDLKYGVKTGILKKEGSKKGTIYRSNFNKPSSSA